jgi:hypothetical protein
MRIAALLLLPLAACKPSEETRLKVIVGATLIDGTGAPPLSRSVVIVAGSRIRAVGTQAATPIPAGSDKFDGAGRFLAPLPVEAPADWKPPAVATLEEARRAIDDGATALAGMIGDTTGIDGDWVRQARTLQVVFFPRLAAMPDGEARDRAMRNASWLAGRGVLIGALGESASGEWTLLARAGLAPMDVLLAATRNAALGIGRQEELGTIAPGRPAHLLMLAANPLEDAAHLARVERTMKGGEWVGR